ncbi:unnamed protein product [Parascedosporium putredinis]|uniref:Uncharacterized protein n=1 Tax=Parascedosporium putredinis TaxID=1442378 RepID=A0A9P1HCR5_9PEZI|nr:unnamed protein product [Parascedosporium putredinis]CAI8004718.1 unnamed protein product [Parascedosporium putredinis]
MSLPSMPPTSVAPHYQTEYKPSPVLPGTWNQSIQPMPTQQPVPQPPVKAFPAAHAGKASPVAAILHVTSESTPVIGPISNGLKSIKAEGDQLSGHGSPVTTPSPGHRNLSMSPSAQLDGAGLQRQDFQQYQPRMAIPTHSGSPSQSSAFMYPDPDYQNSSNNMNQFYYAHSGQIRRPQSTEPNLVSIS